MTSPVDSAGPWTLFELGDALYALATDLVERLSPSVPVVPVPLAPPVIEGLACVAGAVMPVVRLRALIGLADRAVADEDELVVVRAPRDRFALRVDRAIAAAERITAPRAADAADGAVIATGTWRARSVRLIDAARLGLERLSALTPDVGASGRVAELGHAERAAATQAVRMVVEVVAGGATHLLPSGSVTELLDRMPLTPLPLVPPPVAGLTVLREMPLLVLFLADLLGLPTRGSPAGFVAIRLGERRVLFAVDRILGIRNAPADAAVIDPAALVPPDLRRRIALLAVGRTTAAVRQRQERRYLGLTIAGRSYAVPLAAVDRVVEARLPATLPSGLPPALAGAVEIGGRILPVTDGRRWLGLEADGSSAGAHVVLQQGPLRQVLAVDGVRRILTMESGDLTAVGELDRRIEAIGRVGDQSVFVLDPERLFDQAPEP